MRPPKNLVDECLRHLLLATNALKMHRFKNEAKMYCKRKWSDDRVCYDWAVYVDLPALGRYNEVIALYKTKARALHQMETVHAPAFYKDQDNAQLAIEQALDMITPKEP